MKTLLPLTALALVACSQPAAPVVETQSASSARSVGVSTSLPADPQHGAVSYLGIGPLEGIKDVMANGTAVVWAFEDGTSRVSIQLNIAESAQEYVYVGWLADESERSYERLGTLQNRSGDVRHSLVLEAQKDFKRYTAVVVTVESSAGVTTPGQTVAKGILKPTGR